MIFLIPVFLIILLLYVIKIIMYSRNWNNYPVFTPGELPASVSASIVVAFRNEGENLSALLNSLKKQQYPYPLWEVILVDDHSSDNSPELVAEFIDQHSGFRYFKNGRGEHGKKAALLRGIREACHELIITTDADCTMGVHWLSCICGLYAEKSPSLIIGLVDMTVPGNFFNRFQEVEFESLVAAGAGAAASGRPVFCNAANMAFKKKLVLSNGDPLQTSIPSGDDTLFLHNLKRDRTNSIILLKSTQGVVHTRGTGNIREFLNQRSRWASKSRHYKDKDTIYTACLILAMSAGMVVSLISAVAGIYPFLFAVLLCGKGLTDYAFLKGFLRFYGKKLPVLQFIGFEVIYPFYIIISVLAGSIYRYSWKGRGFT